MADQTQLSLVQQGARVWNEWKAQRPIAADLKDADLEGRDLSGADLSGADFEGAHLRGAKLGRGTLLWNANLSKADLHQADLTGADLQDVNFAEADLFEATLREANLQGADLSGAAGGLWTEQLAGANVTDTKLPEHIKRLYDELENVKSISEGARRLFLVVLAACFYSCLTIGTTTDVNLISNRSTSPLPIIQTSIPIGGFYIVAPILVLCVYFYFHFYLQKLWEELGSLPAVFPDGRPLYAKVDPWLLNDLVRAHFPKLNVNRPFLSYFQLWISVLLAWWAVPITMVLFWGRYLRRQELIGTTLHVVFLVLALVAALCLYRLAVATLRGTERKAFAWRKVLTSRRGYQATAFGCAAGLLFGLISLGALEGVRSGASLLGFAARSEQAYIWTAGEGPRTWVPRGMAIIGYPPFANLTTELPRKSRAWDGEKNKSTESVIGPQLSGANLRYASAKGAFLEGADLSGADLDGADLSWSKLSGADQRNANLTDASLYYADLVGANLTDVKLTGVDVKGIDLTNADLHGAHLADSNLDFASMTGARLVQADLSGSFLLGAHLERADLTYASLSDAQLEDADLGCADLRHANLDKVHLKGADLSYSNFRLTRNLDPAELKRANHWDGAFYDDKMLKVLELPHDHNEKLAEQQKKDKEIEKMQNDGESPCNSFSRDHTCKPPIN